MSNNYHNGNTLFQQRISVVLIEISLLIIYVFELKTKCLLFYGINKYDTSL